MSTRIVLGHGASGSAATMAPYVMGLEARGIDARAVDLPRGRNAAAVAIFVAAAQSDPDLSLGGHSYGGRMASLAAAELGTAGSPPPALVCFSYPLHRPGAPEIGPRTAHWPAITCPVLLLSGDHDPFARIDLLRAAVRLLPDAELVAFAGDRHGLPIHRADAIDAAADFLRRRALRT